MPARMSAILGGEPRTKDEIAGEACAGFAHTLEHFLPDGAPTVQDVLDQSASRTALHWETGL